MSELIDNLLRASVWLAIAVLVLAALRPLKLTGIWLNFPQTSALVAALAAVLLIRAKRWVPVHAGEERQGTAGRAGLVTEPAAGVAVATQVRGFGVVEVAESTAVPEVVQHAHILSEPAYKTDHQKFSVPHGGIAHGLRLFHGVCLGSDPHQTFAGFGVGGDRGVGPGVHLIPEQVFHLAFAHAYLGEQC